MYLKLIEGASGRIIEVREPVAEIGRGPGALVNFADAHARVVSARHASLRWAEGRWSLADLGSRNGTFVNGRRVTAATPLSEGDLIRLGETGPSLQVAAVAEGVADTLAEYPGVLAPAPPPGGGQDATVRFGSVSLRHRASGLRFDARGARIRVGRGRECEIQLLHESDAVVSRVHAEIRPAASGALALSDAGSKNGTWLNGSRLRGPTVLAVGDEILLGREGPLLVVERVGAPSPLVPPARAPGAEGLAPSGRALEGRPRGATAVLEAVAALGTHAERRVRRLLTLGVLAVLVLGAAVYGVYVLLSGEVHATAARAASAEDSARAANAELGRELAAERSAAAPAAQVDSLRAQVESAQVRTANLATALARAETSLADQLAQGEARRAAAQSDLARLRDDLANAERRAPGAGVLDSLRRAVAVAQAEASGVDAKLRAVRGTDFATVAERNQGAIGLVSVALDHRYYSGTGFVIAPEGYMLTNWHVIADSTATADTIWVTMADHADAHYASVVASSEALDLALLKIDGYRGPVVAALDWDASRARQGEPAAVIGFPAGSGFARQGSASAAVRTSMTAGIISRVTEQLVQFDGITIGGSSGSPLFNANGEVIAVHRAGLVQSPGFALAIPLKQALVLLPPALRLRIGN